MISPTLTFKAQSLYGAYAPDSGVCCFGGCFEEAVNALHDELQARQAKDRSQTGEERENH
jgi:hypothetical protein